MKYVYFILKLLVIIYAAKFVLSILILLSEAAIWEVLLTSFILLLFYVLYRELKETN